MTYCWHVDEQEEGGMEEIWMRSCYPLHYCADSDTMFLYQCLMLALIFHQCYLHNCDSSQSMHCELLHSCVSSHKGPLASLSLPYNLQLQHLLSLWMTLISHYKTSICLSWITQNRITQVNTKVFLCLQFFKFCIIASSWVRKHTLSRLLL